MPDRRVGPTSLDGNGNVPNVCGRLAAGVVPLRIFDPPLLKIVRLAEPIHVILKRPGLDEKQDVLEAVSHSSAAGPGDGLVLEPYDDVSKNPALSGGLVG